MGDHLFKTEEEKTFLIGDSPSFRKALLYSNRENSIRCPLSLKDKKITKGSQAN